LLARVSRKGGISQASHPKALGCALTHPNITTDFSESLIELVTPPMHSAKEILAFLSKTQQYLYHHLPKDQNFWTASMPCVIRGETYIPIAQYGTINQGMMKTVYRHGLANRYGSVMQTIAGILDKNASISLALCIGGVTNSISDSEKSVVIFGCVNAQPSAFG
jgi:glutamate--cysteine ligase